MNPLRAVLVFALLVAIWLAYKVEVIEAGDRALAALTRQLGLA